jgi:hypothetical protein
MIQLYLSHDCNTQFVVSSGNDPDQRLENEPAQILLREVSKDYIYAT